MPRAANTAVTVDLPQPLRPVMPSVIMLYHPERGRADEAVIDGHGQAVFLGAAGVDHRIALLIQRTQGAEDVLCLVGSVALPAILHTGYAQLFGLAGKAEAAGVLSGVGIHIGFELLEGAVHEGSTSALGA